MKDDLSFDVVKDVFTQYLVEKKHRKTPERFAILEQIHNYDGHFNAETLFNIMENKYRVSLATIYNTLELLVDCRLVVKHQFGEQIAEYEKTFGPHTHHHLVCTSCGTVKEFSDRKIRNAVQSKRFATFDISHYSLYLYGLCRKCKNKENQTKK